MNQKPLPAWKQTVRVPILLVVLMLVFVGAVLVSTVLISGNVRNIRILVTVVFNPTATYEPPSTNKTNTTFISSLASATPAANSFDSSWDTQSCTDLPSSTVGKIVFRIWLQRSKELFRIDEDGNNLCYLMKDDFVDDQPKWSPDGEKIAFVSTRDGYGIYVMDANGSNKTKLTDGGTAYSFPEWSPDGRQIIFQATLDERFDLYSINIDGNDLHNLTNDPRLDISPAWSPDGQYITFASDRTYNPFILNRLPQANNYEIYLMTSDGLNVHRLTSNDVIDSFPSWSPDSQQVVFESSWQEIYIMNKDGSGLRFLTNGNVPIWLPDGQRIAFVQQGRISLINVDRTGLNQISDFSGVEYFDYWMPANP